MGSSVLQFNANLKIHLGNWIEGPYFQCTMTDDLSYCGSSQKVYACQELTTLGATAEEFCKLALQTTSERFLKSYGVVEHEGIFYVVWENFSATLKTFIGNYPHTIQNFGVFIDDMIEGVEELHNLKMVLNENISSKNVFIVKNNAPGKPYTAKLGNLYGVVLDDKMQLDQCQKNDHESVWKMVDGEIFSQMDINTNHELFDYVNLEKRCRCKQFQFYRYHPVKMDVDQKCGMLLYTVHSSNYTSGRIQSIEQSIDIIEAANQSQRANPSWQTSVSTEYAKRATKYSTQASGFLNFCRDSIGHMNQDNKNALQKSFQDFCNDFYGPWPEFMCLLFDGFILSGVWSFCAFQRGWR